MDIIRANTLVTGGTSFIGSHQVEQLKDRVASIDQYFATKDRDEVAATLEASLTER
jgi:nucleoside-diphosphate-sugar epimerase